MNNCLVWQCEFCGCYNIAPNMNDVPSDYFTDKCRECGNTAKLMLVFKGELVHILEE